MAITYKDAGVDIDAGDALVERIKPLARATRIAEVVEDVGGFAGMCAVPPDIVDPVLVSGTDGVGTKLKVAFATGKHDTVGIDLVAMCVNDIITTGARPLFFLDYFATGKLEVEVGEAVVRGVAEGCRRAGCALPATIALALGLWGMQGRTAEEVRAQLSPQPEWDWGAAGWRSLGRWARDGADGRLWRSVSTALAAAPQALAERCAQQLMAVAHSLEGGLPAQLWEAGVLAR